MFERSELLDQKKTGPTPTTGHTPLSKTKKNASSKAGVFRSEVNYLKGDQATEASDAFLV